ncbi:MAG: polyribonucleotide nucleotidyltransferase [Ignavibacteriales bacterium]|nr:polyribonucleotide nucleotidyltransferase [Ignavibacteriales bacterium]MCB9210176.1 polyribonucleotide nucleotidyltransferase [Ignavibacteriales bacterium]MCB9218439.1 polyribonucleotide nucleotidyltransferase [Ignavibacteriales bacterium]MCB9259555.1 polyribonucleotide nucleotidyltransferase [Ignavibacteriales bacterium]
MIYKKEVEIDGKLISIEYGRYARQSNAAVMVTSGQTMVLVVVTMAKEAKEDIDFFPLSVEYREKAFAAGKYPGGFFKREGKPTEKEILSARLIDRPIRPLFSKSFKNETQIIAQVYSYDGENDPDVLAAVGASAALTVSDIPFLEPIGEVRVARNDGKFLVNPTKQQIVNSDLELTIAGTASSIVMVEGEAQEISEEDLLEALRISHDEIKKIVVVQNELRAECGKEKIVVEEKVIDEQLIKDVNDLAYEKYKTLVSTKLGKEERANSNSELNAQVLDALAEKYEGQESVIKSLLHDIEKDLMRNQILTDGLRLDGRITTQIRPITIEHGLLARTHGSSLFTRGETQSLTTLTLGTKSDEQIIDGLDEEYKKRFILHYNFPPFSVGEVGRFGMTSRREIGHGNLAERALKNIIPSETIFPYSIRINSDIMESNGSSSMATVCAGSLALMDGGVPVKCAIAGIAMGLITENDKYSILSDISGNEDHLGDMDFKVAGSSNGITAIQMDIKIQGLSLEIMENALKQAKDGRLEILEKMNSVLPNPQNELSVYAPKQLTTQINPEKIGAVIGPGGKVIQGMQKEFGVDISIEEDGRVFISGQLKENVLKAKAKIIGLTSEPEIGKVYESKVVKIMDFGAFVEFMPNQQGLLHISQIDTKRVNKVQDVLKEGDMITVKLIKVENGKYSLSRKVLLSDEEQKEKSE